MASAAQLEKVSKAIYRIKIGCVSLQWKGTDDSTTDLSGEGLWDIVYRNIKEEKTVVRLGTELSSLLEPAIVARWIHSKPLFGKELQIAQVINPIIAFMKYPIKEIDPKVLFEPQQLVEGILLYDGFLSLWGTQSMNVALNFQRHAAHLNRWLLSISEMGHFLNRTLWHDQAALTSSLRPRL